MKQTRHASQISRAIIVWDDNDDPNICLAGGPDKRAINVVSASHNLHQLCCDKTASSIAEQCQGQDVIPSLLTDPRLN
jgi:hypothetical protein